MTDPRFYKVIPQQASRARLFKIVDCESDEVVARVEPKMVDFFVDALNAYHEANEMERAIKEMVR